VQQATGRAQVTIFGFNTDVKVGDAVYHVQSEAREADLLLQTQVFVKGRCIGKRASSYAEVKLQPEFSIEQMHELLKAQHKAMLDAVKAGSAESLFCNSSEVQNVRGDGLAMKWSNADAVFNSDVAVLRLVVSDGGAPADGALVTSRLEIGLNAPIHSQSATDEQGNAELEVQLPEAQGAEMPVLVRAKYNDKTVTRKFRLKRS
jgi:hypothetical protein